MDADAGALDSGAAALAPQLPTLVEALRVAAPPRLLLDMPDEAQAAASTAAVAAARAPAGLLGREAH